MSDEFEDRVKALENLAEFHMQDIDDLAEKFSNLRQSFKKNLNTLKKRVKILEQKLHKED
jgi:predicted  nucleic acid-binding Zn-ribbon protein